MAMADVEPLDERGSAVRFETQCVVIPDLAHRSRLPRVVTKSYLLPLWKRRTAGLSTSAPPEDDDSHLVLRVPLPTLSLKPHLTTRAVDQAPLHPCLVHRPPSTSPSSPTSPLRNRHARTPRQPSPSPSRPDIITIPLRPCCAACQSVTEAALLDGDAWPEHFSRGASRQRSMSMDGSPRTITVAGSAASASYGALGVSISVDEIDKRRRVSDTEALWANLAKVKEHSSSSSFGVESSPSRTMPATPRIPEEEDDEDENELFPLPSPKRTPSTSPAGSLSSLMVAQPSAGSAPSPTPSSCSVDVPTKRHFLAPPACASSSSLSLPGSTTSFAEAPPRAPSPDLLSALPSLSGRYRPGSPLAPRISCVPPTPTEGIPTDSIPIKPPQHSELAPIPIAVSSFHGPSQSSSFPSPTRLPWRSKYRVSDTDPESFPPAPAPTSSPPSSKKPFSLSSPMQMFTDVLRGVGAMGSPPGIGA